MTEALKQEIEEINKRIEKLTIAPDRRNYYIIGYWGFAILLLCIGIYLFFTYLFYHANEPIITSWEYILGFALIIVGGCMVCFSSPTISILLHEDDIEFLNRKLLRLKNELKFKETQPVFDKGFRDYTNCLKFDPPNDMDFYVVQRYRDGWASGKNEANFTKPRICPSNKDTISKKYSELIIRLKELPESLIITDYQDFVNYLIEEYSKKDILIDLIIKITNLKSKYFSNDSQIFLMINEDPECEDRFLKFYIRQAEYPDDFMDTIHEMWKEYSEDLQKNEINILVMTDFAPLGEIPGDIDG